VKIRDAHDNDLPAIARIAKQSDLLVGELSEENFPSMLTWLYAGAPQGVRLQFVAEHDERIVAHYGAVAVPYKLFDQRCIAGFASNLVIDRDHRAGMLFLSLQSYLQRQYRKLGFRFAYGLITRQNVLEPHLRMGWKSIGKVPVYAKPFNFAAVAGPLIAQRGLRALSIPPLRAAEAVWRLRWSAKEGGQVEEVSRFEADADPFLSAFTSAREITAVRTREILNWRFAGYPERGYRMFLARESGQVAGYVVTRSMQLKHLRALVVVDIAFDPARSATANALLLRCDREAMRLGVDVAATMMNPSSPFTAHLRRFGYLKTPESFSLVAHTPKDFGEPPLTGALFPHWHLTWFDHDYV
jgi:hypothetical protein